MFASIFFLILILALISGAPATASPLWLKHSPGMALLVSLLLYGISLLGIYLGEYYLKRLHKLKKESAFLVANLIIASFFLVAYFMLGAHRLFFSPLLTPFNLTLFSLFSLILYFFALAVSGMIYHRWYPSSAGTTNLSIRFLLPFVFPFLLFVFISDFLYLSPIRHLVDLLHIDNGSPTELIGTIMLFSIAVVAIIIFFPSIVIAAWGCPELKNPLLIKQLNILCQRAHFTHAGFRIWNVLEGSLNAAILGVVSRWRYIIFTQRLLDRLSPKAIEAIVAHEIGHSYHKHLLFYPWILSGIIMVNGLFFLLCDQIITEQWPLYNLMTTSALGLSLAPFIAFCCFAAISGIYFRLVFGYFSRLFERQADLHIFAVDIPVDDMIEAFQEIGVAAGNIHKEPSWHHCSIQERIDFLRAVEQDRGMIKRHQIKLTYSLVVYFILWSVSLWVLFNS